MRAFFLWALALLFIEQSIQAADWPGWRGPSEQGFTDEKNLPLNWDGKSGKNIIWKTPIPGVPPKVQIFATPGHSSPIISGDRIFITTAIFAADAPMDEWKRTIADHHVLCFQKSDGKQLWDTVIPSGKCLVENHFHGYATPTPVTDGKHVYALFGSGVIACLDLDGEIVWREELPRLKDTDSGICSSPILHEEMVIFPGIANEGLRALDKKTGKLKWEQQTRDRNRMATPTLMKIGDKQQLIHFAGGMQGLDPATGDLIWNCRVTSAQSSPVIGSGLIFADSGRGGKIGALVDPTGKGDVSKTHKKWEVTDHPGAAASSAIIVDKYVYRVADPGRIICRDLATGDMVFDERTDKISPSASPIATPDGRIYFASSGKSYIIKAGPKFEVLATNDLEGGQTYATPAVSDGKLYIKGRFNLWCVGEK